MPQILLNKISEATNRIAAALWVINAGSAVALLSTPAYDHIPEATQFPVQLSNFLSVPS